jgi:hypothetical protein
MSGWGDADDRASDGLFRDNQTYDYCSSETGAIVYVFDTSSGQYFDSEGNPI